MKCPSCHTVLAAPAPQCPDCKLTLRRLDIRFGALPLHSRFVTDRSDSLPLDAIKELRARLNLFRHKFPQSLFSVLVMDGVVNGTISEYTFWLANRARFSTLEAVGGENFDLLLGIDVRAGAAALQVGYGLENYLTESDLKAALSESAAAFGRGDIAGGIRQCIEFMTERMREVARNVEHSRRQPIAEEV